MRCVSPSVFKPSSSSFSALTSRADFTQAFWIFTPPSNMAYTSTTPWVFWESVNGSPIMSFLISPSGVLQGQYQPLQAQIYLYCLQYTLTEANTYSIPWSSWVHVTTRWYHSSKTFQTLINGQVVYAGQVTSDSSANSCQDSTSPVTDAVWNPQGLTYTQVALPGLMDELWQFKQALTDSQVQLLIGSNTAASCPAGSFSNADGLTCKVCSAGTFGNTTFSTNCSECPAGTFANSSGSTSCTRCPAGSYTSNNGSSYCLLCGPGEYNSATGQTMCLMCPAGYSQPNYNATSFSSCKSCGTCGYSSRAGSTSCSSCNAGTWCPEAPCTSPQCSAVDNQDYCSGGGIVGFQGA